MNADSRRSAGSDAPEWALKLGRQVRAQRKKLKLTQIQLAELAGCGPDFLYDLERGKPTVRLDKLMPVLEALGLRWVLVTHEDRFTTDPGNWLEDES